MNIPSTNHWLFKATALAVVAVIPIALIAIAAVYVSGMQKHGDAPFVGLLVIYCLPPLCLIALVILGRAEMDMGFGEEPKGELEKLLQKKQVGVLKDQPRQPQSWPEHPASAAAPPTNRVPVENGPMLDQLLATQRRRRGMRRRHGMDAF